MAEAPVLVAHQNLHAFLVRMLGAMKMPTDRAEITAGLMVRTDLRGVDSHGIGMLPRYHELWREGFIVMEADPVVERDDLATGVMDGRKGLGHYVSSLAMRRAIEKAKTYGLGMVVVHGSNHYGAAANYSMMALEHDMIGLSTTNSASVAMVPTFGRAAKIATNPISFAAPARRHAPFVLDMATTTVAVGKLSVASRWKKPIPAGWALDDSGEATTDPFVALKTRLLTPLGGSRDLGSHNGYGLGVMVDILSGVLSGGVYGDLFWRRDDLKEQHRHNLGHCFAAIDPARFRPLAEFKADMDDMIESLRRTPPADGQTRVYVAGEPEAECEVKRRAEGIPVAPVLVDKVNEIAGSLKVAPLA
ncbi:MAG: Ldh family oxidoreductase [Candidatus Rokubacteria bacterium]|nr:Ldh family oxidoreductase [Candidatus Rokubacteria bacterium]